MASTVRTEWVSEYAMRIVVDDAPSDAASDDVVSVLRAIMADRPAGVIEAVPGYTCVTLVFDRSAFIDEARAAAEVGALLTRIERRVGDARAKPRSVEIPVCYDSAFAPDLVGVAGRAGVTVDEAVNLHCGAEYKACFLGFCPGFAYLTGLPSVLHTPRLASPRARVPAGSVAIAGAQSAVYPLATPGGWSIIGRTPLRVFDAARDQTCLIEAGDRVRFVAISPGEFDRIARG